MSKKWVVFLDMDGVLADFDSAIQTPFNKDPYEMYVPGFYRSLAVMPGAHRAVHQLLDMDHIDVYVGSKPSTGVLSCCSEKMEWIAVNLPKLLRKVVFACDKGLLRGHFLVDDNPHLWEGFKGQIFHFNKADSEKSWDQFVAMMAALKDEVPNEN